VATDGAASRGALLTVGETVFEGRFRIEERIAEGGFAVVYKAWQIALDRRVALKVLKAPRHQDEIGRAEFREKFAAEARTIARLQHPNIVDVYDFSVSTLPSGELAPWMALEWLDGETLAMHLERRRRAGERGLDPRDAVAFLRPVLLALAHAHQLGIVHRDVKPANIMVTATAHGPSLRVLDFGIAKIMRDDRSPNTGHTRTDSSPAFSPAYAAPEQVTFSRTGPWTDVHALGLIASEVMTDQPAFSDPDPDAHLFEQVMARRRPTPASKGRDVVGFEPVLAKALALSPRDRWKNAGELLAALDAAEAVGAGAGAPARARRTRRAGLFTALAISAVAGVAWTLHAKKDLPVLPPSSPVASSAIAPVAAPAEIVTPVAPLAPKAEIASSTATAPTGPRKRRKRSHVEPAQMTAGDGRDLFDDTK